MSTEDLRRQTDGNAVFGQTTGSPYQVDTVADLQAIAVGLVPDGVVVIVLGYYSTGDGAGGRFIYDESSALSDNGGTVLAPDAGAGRWLRLVNTPYLNLKWFGALGNGTSDDSVALVNAKVAAQSGPTHSVYVPRGVFKISTAITVTDSPVHFFGEGASSIAYNGYAASAGTSFLWAGGAEAMFTFTGLNDGGGGMRDIRLNCEDVATEGIVLDGCTGMAFEGVTVMDFVTDGLVLTAGDDRTCSWNEFVNVHLQSDTNGHSCLWLTGTPPDGNACHNTFTNLKLVHGGTRHGIVLGYCDNNLFNMTFIFRGSGTGHGVEVDNTESAQFPSGNVFTLLQAGDGGWYQAANVANIPAQIFGYQMDNGQPTPNLNGTDALFFTTSFGTLTGIREFGSTAGTAGNFSFAGTYLSGVTTYDVVLLAPEPDANYRIDLTPRGNIGAWWISAQSASQFTISIPVALGAPVFIQGSLTRSN